MILLSFASVPLYSLFCKVTGYGGTTQTNRLRADYKGKRDIIVNFDSNTEPGLKWFFKPDQHRVKVKTGENVLVFYTAENLTDQDLVGMAIYNVTPYKAGIYFNKIHCFCFEEQTIKANTRVTLPVSFFIDPALEQDPYMQDVHNVTLSYTFFKINTKK